MKKLILFIIAIMAFNFNINAQSPEPGGGDCANAAPICTDYAYDFPLQTGTTSETGPEYGCLGSQPNPAWYYLQISTAGDIDMDLHAGSDVDFIIWGPFSGVTCNSSDLSAANTVDCSYSTAAQEWPSIPNAQVGEVYMMLITNYANIAQDFSLSQSGGTGATDCSIVIPCDITAISTTVDACANTSNQYSVTGSITFNDPPTTGSLTICDGAVCQTFNAPFTSPQNYTLSGITADGGSHTLTASFTDATGCSFSQTYTATQPIINATYNVTNNTCNGSNNGSIAQTNLTGGNGGLTYNWTNTGQSGASITGLGPNTYNLTITDANSCTFTDAFTVTEPLALVVSLSGNAASCGAANGEFSAIVTNGTATYTYTGTGPTSFGPTSGLSSTESTGNTLLPGNYTLNVSDINGCTGSSTITISDIGNVIANIDEPIANQCLTGNSFSFDGSNSTIISAPSYDWDFGDGSTHGTGSTPSHTYASAGTYTVTLTLTDGSCSDTYSVNVVVYPQPTPSAITDNNTLCNGDNNGQATASGGVSYLWDAAASSQATAIATGLGAGTYTVTVSDANNCTATTTATITEPPALVITVAITDAICNGDATGIANCLITTSSTPNFDYDWSTSAFTHGTPNTNVQINTFTAGTYSVTVTDANNCSESQNFVIGEPLAWNVINNVTDATCGNANGAIDLTTVTGNTASYTFDWSSGQTTQNISGINAGGYVVTITDANSCTYTENISVANAGAPSISVTSSNNPTCFGYTDGDATATLTTPTVGPYTYLWIPSGGSNLNATGLGAGTYTIQVTDGNNCVATDNVTLTEPTQVIATLDSIHDDYCGQSVGDIYISVLGGTVASDYGYIWNSGQTTQDNTSIPSGTYSVNITDDNSCPASLTGINIVDIPGPTISVSIVSQPLCPGDCNAIAEVTINTTTTSPYNYVWDNGLTNNIGSTEISDTVSGLCAITTYSVTVTDANGCSAITSIKPTDPTPVTAVIASSVDVLCNGENTGSASVGAHGGTPGYTYLWDGGLSTTDILDTGLTAGTFNVVVTDTHGCTDNASVTITEPTILTVSIDAVTDETCGLTNGDITASANGGTPTYTFQWDAATGNQVGTNPTNLSGNDTYWLTVTDANSCTVITNSFIDSIPAGTISITNTNITCFGDDDGTATASIAGGTMPFNYVWDNGYNDLGSNLASSQATNISPGVIIITMTDANNCIISTSATITEPDQLVNTFTIDTLECNAYCDASINTGITGGVTPYAFIWDDVTGSSTPVISSLCAGTYNVTVTDAHNCSISEGVTIIDPPAMSLSAVIDSSSCNQSDGNIALTVNNQTPPMSFNWTGPSVFTSTDTSLYNVPAGTYYVTVTNSNSCTISSSYTVIDEASPLAIMSDSLDVNCFNAANGFATVSVTGGTGAGTYTYLWDDTNTQTTATATGLSGGTYTVVVTDANNCISIANVDIFEPTLLEFNYDLSNPLCNAGTDGWASVSPYGGTSPYSYSWTGTGTNPNDSLYTDLSDGLYSVQITDANGCDTIINNIPINEPTFMAVNSVITDDNCYNGNDGSIALTISGGTSITGDYTISWDANTGGQTSTTASALTANTYCTTITDDNLCTLQYCGTVTEPTELLFTSTTSTNLNCFQSCDGSIDIGTIGGTIPVSYYWETASNPGIQFSIQEDLSNLCAGTYFVTATDNNGCTIDTSIIINQPLPLTLSLSVNDESCYQYCDGTITPTVTGGTTSAGTYNFLWSDNSINSTFTGCGGTYSLIVTDAHGCTISQSESILNAPQLSIMITNVTDATCNTPNGSITIAVSGGTGSPNIQWDANTGNAITSTVNNLNAAIYYVEVTDANYCTVDTTIPINNYGGPILDSVVIVDVTCFGDDDGSMQIYWHQPTPPASSYTVTWAGYPAYTGQNTLPNLGEGDYFAQITDNNGCFTSANAHVNEPVQVSSTITNVTDATCYGTCNGDATVNTSGGIAPYTWAWSNGAGTNSTANNLCDGIYQVTSTDANNCTSTSTAIIAEPDSIIINLVSTVDASCNGYNDGSVTIQPENGSGSYNYQWFGGGISSIDQTVGNLQAGTSYTVIVTDAYDNSCQVSSIYTIGEPNPIVISDTSYNTTCNQSNGTAIVTNVTGGTPTYSYQWSPCPSPTGTCPSNSINGLNNGPYNVTVTDSHSCSETSIITVYDTPPPYLFSSNTTDVNCFGGSSGIAEIIVKGGTEPYSYFWSNGGQDSININLASGTYWVTVTDADGCEVITTFAIDEPSQIAIFADGPTTPVCINQLTHMSVSANGGTGTFNYVWSDATLTGQNVTAYPVGDVVYTVYAIDGNGCISPNAQVNIQVYPPIHVVVSPDVSICLGETTQLTAVATGGNYNSSYTYSWNTGIIGNPINVSPIDTFTYYVWAQDLCNSPSDTASVTVNVNLSPQITSVLTNEGCEPLDAILGITLADTSMFVVYNWNLGDGSGTSSEENPQHVYNNSGSYDVSLTLTSINGCKLDTTFIGNVIVFPNPDAAFYTDKERASIFDALINFSDATDDHGYPINWNWDFGDDSPMATNPNVSHIYEQSGNYTVMLAVMNNKGCTDTVYNNIEIYDEHRFYMPNAFRPLQDNWFYPKGIGIIEDGYHFSIYNRWGEIIFETTEYPEGTDVVDRKGEIEGGWNGKYMNTKKLVQTDIYVWYVTLVDINGYSHEYAGWVNVIR